MGICSMLMTILAQAWKAPIRPTLWRKGNDIPLARRLVWIVLACFFGSLPLPARAELASYPFGNLRLGFINARDVDNKNRSGSAIGGKLGYLSQTWRGLSAGVAFYTSGELFDDENSDFFSSENNSYSILGEAYVKGELTIGEFKIGRFDLETPHADTDDIRMVPNTFQGLTLSSHIAATTLLFAHLDKWAGVDAEIPEQFEEINGDKGLTIAGLQHEMHESWTLQLWYYLGRDFANLLYLETMVETDQLSLGVQYGSQHDDSADKSGPDGDVWGLMASYPMAVISEAVTHRIRPSAILRYRSPRFAPAQSA